MADKRLTILVVGATGSIGRHVVDVAGRLGHRVRALVRDPAQAAQFPVGTEVVMGDLTRASSLATALDHIDAVIFTHGSNGNKEKTEAVDYGAVRNVLVALGPNDVRIALMTLIGVTNRSGPYNRSTEAHDWKRRSERLLRASGLSYTIVRPGWFDYNDEDQHRLSFLQGDTRQSGTSRDGVIAREQVAEVLVHSLTSPNAIGKTFELVAVQGRAPTDFEPLFALTLADVAGSLDAVRDTQNMPIAEEPARVLADLYAAGANVEKLLVAHVAAI